MVISEFRGEFAFLSNFFPAEVILGGVSFPTVEHAFQAAKTLDREARIRISKLKSPGQAKRAGQKVQMRDDWEKIKLIVMEQLVRNKFWRHELLRDLLLKTGDAILVEGNTWGDIFWGVCDGVGENHLGRILMRIRTELQN